MCKSGKVKIKWLDFAVLYKPNKVATQKTLNRKFSLSFVKLTTSFYFICNILTHNYSAKKMCVSSSLYFCCPNNVVGTSHPPHSISVVRIIFFDILTLIIFWRQMLCIIFTLLCRTNYFRCIFWGVKIKHFVGGLGYWPHTK